MFHWVKNYIGENLRRSFLAWDEGERVINLLVLLGSGLVAFAVAHIIGKNAEIASSWLYSGAALGWLAFVLLLATPYRMWKHEKQENQKLSERLTPKAEFEPFLSNNPRFMHRTKLTEIGTGNYVDDIFYVAACPKATADEPVRGCEAVLVRVEKSVDGGHFWQPTSYANERQLPWEGLGHVPKDLTKGLGAAFNVFTIQKSLGIITPEVKGGVFHRDAEVFADNEATYRFVVAIKPEGQAWTVEQTLEVRYGPSWHRPQVRSL